MHSVAEEKWTRLLLAIYLLSGITGVAYEVLWVRMLAIQFGVSSFGVVITLVAFMSGLGFGGLLGAWMIRRVTRPLILFALLEGAVAIAALSMPWLFGSVDLLLGMIAADSPLVVWFLLQGVTSFVILFLPALALGVGFPLILRYFDNTSITIVSVYGLNTLGGAFGALLPLFLLPLTGWSGAVLVVASLGLAVAFAAILVTVFDRNDFAGGDTEGPVAGLRPTRGALLCYAGIGAGALMLQVGWTRLYGMLLLRTEYVLAIILCIFLAGVALGSLFAKRFPPRHALTWFPLIAAATSLLSLAAVPWLGAWADGAEFDSLGAALVAQGMALAILTLPTTLVLGAWLPVLSLNLGAGGNMTGAWYYGANCVGAALGALIGGLVLVPLIGTAAMLCLAALMLFVFGMAWSGSRRMWFAAPLLLVAAWPIATLPEVNRLLPGTHGESRDLMVHEDALSITHVIERADGQRILLSDLQRMEASTDAAAVAAQMNMSRLPLILHPDPERVLFLGLGTGITAAGALAVPDPELVAVELSTGAIQAARDLFAPVNHGVMEKARIVHDDARRFLRASDSEYDVIVGDLFHPDLVGRSNLLSVQQFHRVRDRLAGDGIFVQWLAMNQFDRESLAIVMRSFRRVFPDAGYFIDGFRIALVGAGEQGWDVRRILEGMDRLDRSRREALTGNEGLWTWLGRYWGQIPAEEGPVQDEWAPRIEYSLPRARYRDDFDLGMLAEHLLRQRPPVASATARLGIPPGHVEEFEAAYIATELATLGWIASINNRPAEGTRLLRMALEANPRDRWIGYDIADRMYATLDQGMRTGIDRGMALERILSIRPDHTDALHDLWQLALEEGNEARAREYRSRLEALVPLDHRLRAGR